MEDYNNVDLIEEHITEKTAAIMGVHLYGQLCDMEALKIFEKYNLKLIEDAAQHMAHVRMGKKLVIAMLLVLVFIGEKFRALGDAGCVTTNDKILADKLSMAQLWLTEISSSLSRI